MSLTQRFATTLIVGATRLLTGVQARWRSEPQAGARIYFANHSSHLDGAVIWASLPPLLRPRTRAVAALDYWEKSALRRYLAKRVFNVLMIDRNPQQSREQRNAPLQPLLDALDTGDALILFPEGTRGEGECIAPFKSGLYHLARQRPDVALVPVYLENLNRILPKGSLMIVPLLCSAIFGAPMCIAAEESRDDFLLRARQALEELAP